MDLEITICTAPQKIVIAAEVMLVEIRCVFGILWVNKFMNNYTVWKKKQNGSNWISNFCCASKNDLSVVHHTMLWKSIVKDMEFVTWM